MSLAILMLVVGLESSTSSACIALDAELVFAGDLASQFSEFGTLSPNLEIASAPALGTTRTFHGPELQRIAARFGISLPAPHDVCVERKRATLTPTRVAEVMKGSLGMADAQIEILEISHQANPEGTLNFPAEGLAPPATSGRDQSALWRGYIEYQSGKKFDIWARVKITAPVTRVIALEPLPAGKPIAKSQVKIENRLGFPDRSVIASSLNEVIGRVPNRSISSSAPIWKAWLQPSYDISRTETVRVEVVSGSARLSFTGRAETSGSHGDVISVKNLQSGKTFQARVERKGSVSLILE
jgi:flagella basal body P-ring formation protein FlgA